MIYKWKNWNYAVDAQIAGEELERIEKKNNGITPREVVNESRNKEAVLHKCFEWDDQFAAESFREIQAKEILRHIVVVRTEEKEEIEEPVRAFVNVVSEEDIEERKYISIENALNNEEYERQLFNQALKEALAFKQKYYNLQEFKKVFAAINAVAEKQLKEAI
jgi:hypothetical protein